MSQPDSRQLSGYETAEFAVHGSVNGSARSPSVPSRNELFFIGSFWTLYGLLTLANRLFDGRGPAGSRGITSGAVVVALVDSLSWALLTVLIFWLVNRYGTERSPRSRQVLLFVALGVVVIAATGIIGTETRELFDAPPERRGRRPGRLPFWFGMIYSLVIYLGVVSAAFARSFSQRYHVRREQANLLHRQLAEARLDALRRQLDPHFLFNTLNAVSSLVERDPRGVRRMISRLGDLLRFSLEGASEPEIPLRQELVLLGQYLDIMQVRFQGRLTVDTQTDDRTLDLLVPTLILQPLVENAIKHGVEELPEGGHVLIETTLDGDVLTLRVSDNGVRGVHLNDVLARPATGTGGVGIRNTVARLSELYGARQSFTMRPGATAGTVAEIRLPAHSLGARGSAA
ncbi:MAG: histidine kinase [bacterium]